MGFTSGYLYSFLVLLFGGSAITAFELLAWQLFVSFICRALYASTIVQSKTLPGLIPNHSGKISYARHSASEHLIDVFCFPAIIFHSLASQLISAIRKTGFYSGIYFVRFISFVQLIFCSQLFAFPALQLLNEMKTRVLTSWYFGKQDLSIHFIYKICEA